MSDEQEQWKPWPRDTWYEVSNLGRVRSGPSRKILCNTGIGMARHSREKLRRWLRYVEETSATRPLDEAGPPQGGLGL